MNVPAVKRHRLERLIFLPVLGLLVISWGVLALFSFSERDASLEHARSQLATTLGTLADFNELATGQPAGGADGSGEATRTAAIWRALLQYPTANIWFETDGSVTAGEPPQGSRDQLIQVDDVRSHFVAHAALRRNDALQDWRRSLFDRLIIAGIATLAFLALTGYLARVVKQRSIAERDSAAAAVRASELSLYKVQLEETVAKRTVELQDANARLGTELVERKAVETALREHDDMLRVVTRGAAELLSDQHDDAIATVLELVGQTIGVSRVQLCAITFDSAGHMHTSVQHEWCPPSTQSAGTSLAFRNSDLTAHLDWSVTAKFISGFAAFHSRDIVAEYREEYESAGMRSFLLLPVLVEDQLWGSLNFIDSATEPRNWSWAETDSLKTLTGLIGAAIARAKYVRELSDANMIVQNSPTILFRLRGEPALPLIYISHNIVKFGHDPHRLIANPNWFMNLIEAEDLPKLRDATAQMLKKKNVAGATIEFRFKTGDGARRWVESRYTPVRDPEGRLIEIEGVIVDITERKAAEEKIAQLARTDALTDLANRATFLERLRQAYASAQRGSSPFAILYIDLDHFKPVNDTLGHSAGDQLLRLVADRLRSAVRGSDLVARLGGDEFAILQLEMPEPAGAGALAAKIQQLLAEPFTLGPDTVAISASIGVCPYLPGASANGPEALLAQADLALYRSKEEGRNQFRFHTEDLDRQMAERLSVADGLRKAIERDELELYYQPQVEILSGRIVGMEVLLRWNHPTRGVLLPSYFLPVAEKSSMMVSVGHWVLTQACKQLRSWRDRGRAPPTLCINLSLAQLKTNRELIRDVVDTTARWNLSPTDFEFDVTEATLAQITLADNDVLARLRQIGAKVAIDDFGTEYSSFNYLRSYGINHVKIAQSYIRDSVIDPNCAAIVRGMIGIARDLGIGVIAEGVETVQERELLISTGSAQAQGHFYSKAVSAMDAEALLRRSVLGPDIPALPFELEPADRRHHG